MNQKTNPIKDTLRLLLIALFSWSTNSMLAQDGQDCCICLNPSSINNPEISLCPNKQGTKHHWTCMDCTADLIKGSAQPKCPICRHELNPIEIQKSINYETAKLKWNAYRNKLSAWEKRGFLARLFYKKPTQPSTLPQEPERLDLEPPSAQVGNSRLQMPRIVQPAPQQGQVLQDRLQILSDNFNPRPVALPGYVAPQGRPEEALRIQSQRPFAQWPRRMPIVDATRTPAISAVAAPQGQTATPIVTRVLPPGVPAPANSPGIRWVTRPQGPAPIENPRQNHWQRVDVVQYGNEAWPQPVRLDQLQAR